MPKTAEITVSSGRTLPHPTINYASFRADISVRFVVNDGDDITESTLAMQEWADKLSLKHIMRMIAEANYDDRRNA